MAIDSRWARVEEVPAHYTREIKAGSLKGKSDISPQWRTRAMTELYGLQGEGWTWTETGRDTLACGNGEVLCFVQGVIKYKTEKGEWSSPIEGNGGNKLIALANGKPKPNDEGWKMATTDAIGTALKGIGFASKVYEGSFDGSKYLDKGAALAAEKIGLERRTKLLEHFPENIISGYEAQQGQIAEFSLEHLEMVKAGLSQGYLLFLHREVNTYLKRRMDCGAHQNELSSSISKHLGVNRVQECQDHKKLEDFANHNIHKIDELTAKNKEVIKEKEEA